MTMELDSVHCCDALELLRSLDTQSVDAVITDPPYNTTQLAWEQAIDWSAFWVEVKRVLMTPKSPVIMFSAQPFTTDLICSNRKWFRHEIIWNKTMPTGFLDANRRPLRNHENIMVFGEMLPNYAPQFEVGGAYKSRHQRKDRASHYGKHREVLTVNKGKRYPKSVWSFSLDVDGVHPTQKPIALMERLVLSYTKQGQIVVDPFAGSGTTGVAARNTNRRYILGDSSAEYCQIAKKRLAQPFTTPMFE